jgi:hypothetical protein
MKKILTFLLAFFIMSTGVLAACSVNDKAELNQKAANVKVTYEIKKETIQFNKGAIDYPYFKISILNVDDDLQFVVKNNIDKGSKTYKYADAVKDIITFNNFDTSKIFNYTIEVYISDTAKCYSEKLRTIYLTTPRRNDYYQRAVCNDYPDFYMCQEYVTFEDIPQSTFEEKLDSYQKGKIADNGEEVVEKTFFDKVFGFIDKYKFIILGGTIVIVGGAIVIARKKNKKSRELGL